MQILNDKMLGDSRVLLGKEGVPLVCSVMG